MWLHFEKARIITIACYVWGGGKLFYVLFSFYLRVLRQFLNLPSLWLILLQDLSFFFFFSFWKLNLRFEFYINRLVSRPFFPCGCSTWMMTETRLSKTTLFEWDVRAIISPAIRENGAVVPDRKFLLQFWKLVKIASENAQRSRKKLEMKPAGSVLGKATAHWIQCQDARIAGIIHAPVQIFLQIVWSIFWMYGDISLSALLPDIC